MANELMYNIIYKDIFGCRYMAMQTGTENNVNIKVVGVGGGGGNAVNRMISSGIRVTTTVTAAA